jgi:hypothetical protein
MLSGKDSIVLISAYFDESFNGEVMCVAGYLMTARNARFLDSEWRKMLIRYGNLPYFRMSACNAGSYPFDKLDGGGCISVATEAIDLIGKYVTAGCAVTVDQAAFYDVVTKKGFVRNPYELAVWICLTASQQTASEVAGHSGTAFFFEAGCSDQASAGQLMNVLFNSPQLKASYKYRSHGFIDKHHDCAIQAADLLSWQWYKDHTRRANGAIKMRGDLNRLQGLKPHHTIHIDREIMQEMVDGINELAGSSLGNRIAGESVRNSKSPVFPKNSGGQGSAKAFQRLALSDEAN